MHTLSTSFLDPLFQNMQVRSYADEIELFILEKRKEIDNEYKSWGVALPDDEVDQIKYLEFRDDTFSDKYYTLEELERNLLNGLAITLQSILEKHISIIIRESLRKTRNESQYKETITYHCKDLVEILKIEGHPNIHEIPNTLLETIESHFDVRNCLLHSSGVITDRFSKTEKYRREHSSELSYEEGMKRIGVKKEYLDAMVDNMDKLFKPLVYSVEGKPIYY